MKSMPVCERLLLGLANQERSANRQHRRETRRFALEPLETRRLMACDVADGIALENGVLCIDGTPYDDTVTIELVFTPTTVGGLAGNTDAPIGSDGDNPEEGVWTIKAELLYDPGPSIYDDPQADSTEVEIDFSVDAAGVDEIYFAGGGGDGSDTFRNNTHLSSTAYGGGGVDNLFGGSGSDHFYGGDGADNIYGNGGVDFLRGQDGNDDLYGGPGGDYLYGGDDYDDLYGGDGADRLYAQDGPDTLNGGGPNAPGDSYSAYDGSVDLLSGGGDIDIFVPEMYTAQLGSYVHAQNYDTIDDCQLGEQIQGYEGDSAAAICNGETVQVTYIPTGPLDETSPPDPTHQAVDQIELPARHLDSQVDARRLVEKDKTPADDDVALKPRTAPVQPAALDQILADAKDSAEDKVKV